jgi:hypothetical protein
MSGYVTVWRVKAGSLTRLYYTSYHAEQMGRALTLRGMDVTIDTVKLRNDPLTRLMVSP